MERPMRVIAFVDDIARRSSRPQRTTARDDLIELADRFDQAQLQKIERRWSDGRR